LRNGVKVCKIKYRLTTQPRHRGKIRLWKWGTMGTEEERLMGEGKGKEIRQRVRNNEPSNNPPKTTKQGDSKLFPTTPKTKTSPG